MGERRASRKEIGDRAEDVVADYLVANGYTLAARNLRLGKLEIDIVARRGSLIAIVEVRTRGAGSYQGGLASITPRKRELLLRAADTLWRREIRAMPDIERVRIDVAVVTFGPHGTNVEHIEGAIVAE